MRFDLFDFERKFKLFATAAVDVLGGAGGSDGGAAAGGSPSDGGGSPAGADAGLDSGAGTGISPETQAGDVNGGGATDQLAADPNALDGDGRLIPQKYRELFKNDKDLRNLWFANANLKKEVPGGLNEVRQLKQFHAEVGGPEGVEALRQVGVELEQIDAQLEAGDPKLIERVASNPETFSKLMGSGLEQWAKSSPENYQHTMARVMLNTFNNSGATNILNQLQTAIAGKNFEQASQAWDKFADWFGGIEGIAAKQPEKKIDPERQKLDNDRQQFETERTKTFQTAVGNDVKSHYQAGFDKELSTEMKARGLDLAKIKAEDPESYGILIRNCDLQLGAELKKDQTFIKQYTALLKSMDQGKATAFAKAKIDKVLTQVVQKTYRAFNRLGGGPAAKAQPNPAAPPAGPQIVKGARPPAQDQIDWQRTKPGQVLDGEAYLKGKPELYKWEA